jgi:hypothetical protein
MKSQRMVAVREAVLESVICSAGVPLSCFPVGAAVSAILSPLLRRSPLRGFVLLLSIREASAQVQGR